MLKNVKVHLKVVFKWGFTISMDNVSIAHSDKNTHLSVVVVVVLIVLIKHKFRLLLGYIVAK